MEKSMNYVEVDELERLLQEDGSFMLIDARTPEEFADGHVPGAVNIGIVELAEFAESGRDAPQDLVVTMCGSAGRGKKAAEILLSHGFGNVLVLQGGLKAWKDAGFPIA